MTREYRSLGNGSDCRADLLKLRGRMYSILRIQSGVIQELTTPID